MKIAVVSLIITFVAVECDHTFLGTNIQTDLIYHHNVKFSSKIFHKGNDNIYNNFTFFSGESIEGVLAYDLTHSDASANITKGGPGHDFVHIWIKSGRGQDIDYDIYIYA